MLQRLSTTIGEKYRGHGHEKPSVLLTRKSSTASAAAVAAPSPRVWFKDPARSKAYLADTGGPEESKTNILARCSSGRRLQNATGTIAVAKKVVQG